MKAATEVAIAALLLMGWRVQKICYGSPCCERFKADDGVHCFRNATLISEGYPTNYVLDKPIAVCRMHAVWAVKQLEKR